MNERIKAGADIHAGNGGYEISTREKYEAFVKVRNKSLARARIRELWDKAAQAAAAYPSGQNNSWETQVNFMEKFAELIVRECVDAIDSARPYHTNDHLVNDYMNGVEHGHKFAITMIKKHFGVEE